MDKNKIIEGLYLNHKDHIYNFLARMTNDPDLALDVTQQTFVKALSDKNFHQVSNPKAYLFTIARNTLFNEFKKKKPTSLDTIEEAGDFETADENENLHANAELKDIQAKVEKSIKRMPVKFKELMILRYTEDLSIKEIASITGRTLSDVKVNLHRSRIKFESTFTHEMYAKIAASRDQCDSLTTLLAPYINSDIPEQELISVDKHISTCNICKEDAEQLKRSRTLFNLASLMSLPYIFDQMMGDAMASEFNFLAPSGQSAKTSSTIITTDKNQSADITPETQPSQQTETEVQTFSKNSTNNTTIASHVTQKIISTKVASVIGIAIIIAAVIINNLLNDDEVIAFTKPLNTTAVTSDPNNQKTTPAKPGVTNSTDNSNLPNIHIRRLQTGTQESTGLKMLRNLCVTSIDMYKKIRKTYPQRWIKQEKQLKEDNPDFNLDRGIAPEPDWSSLTENYEDEYFSGEKYALYKILRHYEVSENGSCKVIYSTEKTAEIDDGKFSYYIDFIEKTADKNTSRAVLEKQTQEMFQNLYDNNTYLAQAMGAAMTEAMLGETGSEQEKKSLDAIKQLEKLTEVAGTQTIAGETCEYTHMGEKMGMRICLWKPMHQYPSIVKRDIVLGMNVNLDPNNKSSLFGQTTSKAIVFEKDIELSDAIFSAPSDIKIINRIYE